MKKGRREGWNGGVEGEETRTGHPLLSEQNPD